MDQTRLHALLAELDTELKSTPALDKESRALLRRVLKDLPLTGAPARVVEDQSTETRLRELVLRFEADHPRLSGAVSQVADALGKLGI